MAGKLKLQFTKDEPILETSSGYFNFYHKNFVPALISILNISDGVRTVGLFGGWGTGKSTVIEQLKVDKTFIVPTFDVWKYKDDSLRRAFLIYLFDFLKAEGLLKRNDSLEQEIKGLYVSTEISKDENLSEVIPDKNLLEKLIEFAKKHWMVIGVIFLLVLWVLLRVFFSSNEFLNAIRALAGYAAFSAPIWWIIQKVSEKVMGEYITRIFSSYEPLIKTQTITEKREALNSPEQFELLFTKTIESLAESKKLVIVFDNLDRVEGKVAVQVLTTVKTFLEPAKLDNVVFVIPCDYEAVRKQVLNNYADSDPDEFLRKLFGVTLWTPDYILGDLEEYTRKLIQQTGDTEGLINKEEVISVIIKAFRKNPRQIKQFINNFVAQLYVASTTPVWDIIKEKTEYLAKVLIIRQHYPLGYERLKTHWFEPEQIYLDQSTKEKDEVNLREFVLTTQKITVANAKPFIYFKKPSQAGDVLHPEELQQAFIQESVGESVELIKKQTDHEKLGSYITGLYSEYGLLTGELVKIIKTHLAALSVLKIKLKSQQYFTKTINLIDEVLWGKYLQLPTSLVFEQLIQSDDNLLPGYRKGLVLRYATALSNEDFVGGKNIEIAIEIVKNILTLPKNLVTKEAVHAVRDAIEKNFKAEYRVLEAFSNEEVIEDYVTEQMMADLIGAVTVEKGKNSLPLLTRFSKKIEDSANMINNFIDFVTRLSVSLAGIPEYPTEKAILIAEVSNSLAKLKPSFGAVPREELNKLAVELYKVAKQIPIVDNKKDALLALFELYDLIDDPHKSQIKEQLNAFIQTSTPANLDSFLIIINQRGMGELFVAATTPHLQGVFRTREDCRKIVYDSFSNQNKTAFLVELITVADDFGLPYVKSLESLPDRHALISALLSRLSSMDANKTFGGYLWAIQNMAINDDESLKLSLSNNILIRAKIDDNTSGELSYKMFEASSDALGKARCSEIAENILQWLREPNRLNSNHSFALQLVIFASKNFPMADTSKRDLVHLILRGMRQESNTETINMLIGALKELNPKYLDNEESFDNLLIALKDWPDVENRRNILSVLMGMRTKARKKKEKSYWQAISDISG